MLTSRDVVAQHIAKIDRELAPILEAERQRQLAAYRPMAAPAAEKAGPLGLPYSTASARANNIIWRLCKGVAPQALYDALDAEGLAIVEKETPRAPCNCPCGDKSDGLTCPDSDGNLLCLHETLPRAPTAADIRHHRDVCECSLEEAKRDLMAAWRRDRVQFLRRKHGEIYTIEQCRDAIADVFEFLAEITEV